MTLVVMSTQELCRVDVIRDVAARRLTAAVLGISRRQVFRLLRSFQTTGYAGLVSRRRGQPSNRRYPEAIRDKALSIVRERYADFGPTLVAEKLSEVHGLSLSRETLRQWMLAEGLWLDRTARRRPVHQPRPRRDCLGELIQIDGCEHWWFEERGPQCTLLVYVDDATSRLMHLQFVVSESAFDYFRATRAYLEAYGKPLAFYSDKHSIFRITKADAIKGTGMTQFGRALHELSIEILCANSPQAKGRVERAHRTLQDRLVKELRLRGISTMAAGNEMLPAFMADYNTRFAKNPREARNLHRAVSATDALADILAWQEERTVSNSLTLQYDKVLFVLEPTEIARELRRKRVMVIDAPDGRLVIRYKGMDLPYTLFDKLRQVHQGVIVENKRLGAVLAEIREQQIQDGEPRRRAGEVRQTCCFQLPELASPGPALQRQRAPTPSTRHR
jgi:Homeodomain-like domain